VAQGQTIVIVEQNIRTALGLAQRAYVLDKEGIVFEGSAERLRVAPGIMDRYLGAQGRSSLRYSSSGRGGMVITLFSARRPRQRRWHEPSGMRTAPEPVW
jgi:energy-coupling factor transporter ATP-binding protein EcfA2